MSTADIVNEWFRERLSSGPLGRSTDAHNQVVGVLPALIAALDRNMITLAAPARGGKTAKVAQDASAATPPPSDAAAPPDPNASTAKTEA